ncbi:toprim domain-containing protein [Nanoarchaeota archaeon]
MEEVLEELELIRHKTVIVEGKNDKKALEKLGFDNVITLDKPLYLIVEEIEDDEVVILTDLDKAGKELYGKLAKDFLRRGVKIDSRIRRLLFKTDLRQIEGLANYIDRKR